MIAHWADIEADFTREYPGIDFNRDVWSMSWRRFIVLLRGLSSTSWWQLLCRAKANTQADRFISDEAAAERYFAGIT